ncbi:MAG: gliding motility-associated C-terminal domain-containing protein [Chitinophagaceae bacterium]|nr:gliding motility-associated C-terminal domain-containing protein [Chitinophagaceae bacterium]
MNNTFKPIVYGVLENFYMAIYNRYGQKVYETTDATKGWNGQINGQQQGTNTFVWTARYKFVGQVMKVDKGTVTLVR